MKKEKNKADFKHEIIKVFRGERVDEKNRIDLRIVRWNTGKGRTIENRRIWECGNGNELFRKMVGLGYEDVKFIVDNSEEILKLLKEDTVNV